MSVRRSTNTENLVRGADTLLHQGTMLAKAALWAISSGVLVGSVVVSIGASLVTTGTERTFAYKHIAAKTKVFFRRKSTRLILSSTARKCRFQPTRLRLSQAVYLRKCARELHLSDCSD